MKIIIPFLLALILLLAAFSFVRAEAASVQDSILPSSVSMAAMVSLANLTSTITATEVVTTAIISGVVVNGSGIALPEDLLVTLYAYQPGQSMMDLVMTNTNAARPDGAFTFENISKTSESVFMTSVVYDGIPYHSAPGFGEPLTITVFDVVTDTHHLLTDQLHVILDFSQPEAMQVMEVYILSNVGNQTILLGEGNQLMTDFPLPENVLAPEYRSGPVDEIGLQTDDGYQEIPALRPGEQYGVSFVFVMPYPGKVTLKQPFGVPVSSVGVLLPALGSLAIESENLIDGGFSNFGELAYRIYSGGNLLAGSQLVMEISGDPSASVSENQRSPLGVLGSMLDRVSQTAAIGIALGGLVFLLGLLLSFRNRKISQEPRAEPSELGHGVMDSDETAVPEDAESIMDDIIALDDLYQAGQLPEAAYHKRRAELKEKLRAVTEGKDL